MSRERIVLIVLAVLAIGALLFAGAAAGQRGAWMEGYMMGRLSAVGGSAEAAAGAGAAAAMLPYAPYGVGFVHRGPGFGGILLVLGAVAFGLFVCRFVHRARWARWQAWMAMQGAQQGAQAGAQPGPQGWPQGDWRHGPPPPWMHGPWGRGPWGQNPWAAQSPASAEQSQQPSQPGQQPQQPQQPQPPAGEPGAER